ncbi:MAG: hypothetical protein JW885_09410 [Deltaproteobacteria bacterium]|nr:hypothetical protein [Candidatus Zymogenaceae bacterium]
MYYHLIPVPLALIGIAVYFWARKKNNLNVVAVVQPLNTAVVMVIAALGLLTPAGNIGFTVLILAGLLFALVGDINNVDMTDEKTVMVGLLLFVVAYAIYPVAFTVYGGFFIPQDFIVIGISVVLYVVVIAYCWRGLTGTRIAGMVYGFVLFFLLSRAISTCFSDAFSHAQAILLTAGAAMIFLGDIQFALETFRKPPPPRFVIHLKVIGPILYAGGQLLIGLSTAYFPNT